MYRTDQLKEIAENWQIELARLRPDIHIAGSPERTEYRMVIEDTSQQLWLLEKVPAGLCARKRHIARYLNQLHEFGMIQVVPCRPSISGEAIVAHRHGYWQVCPFISGMDLNRPAYVSDGWRGETAARFLIDLQARVQHLTPSSPAEVFSLPLYISDMMDKVRRLNPELTRPLTPIVEFLSTSFFPDYPRLPILLCHGDFHPLNILWGENRILGVIDWEFFGFKPQGYDAANFIGCLGMEDPTALIGPLVAAFLRDLNSAAFLQNISRRYFLELMLAIRFGWMSEWLRKKDGEMIDLELTYLYLLMDNREKLKSLWE